MADIGADATGQTIGQNIVRGIGNLAQTIAKIFPSLTGGTSTSATSGSATLPGNPVGYINAELPDGTPIRIPFYAP